MVKLLKNKKFVCITACLMLTLAFASVCFASGDHLDGLSFTPIISAVTSQISPMDIVTLIGMTIAAGMAFVLAWFGIRKVIKALKGAIFGGKIRG